VTAGAAPEAFRDAVQAALGYAPASIEPGRLHRFATSDRRADTAGWCKLFDDHRGGVYGCHRRGLSETWSAADPAQKTREQRAEFARQVLSATIERVAQRRRLWAANAQRNARLWAQCLPLASADPVSRYLERRGVGGAWPLPALLRLHPSLPYWHGAEKLGEFPAMVAPIVAPDGRTLALHRTYLTADGRKAGVPSPKKLTAAAGPLAGACIPLRRPVRGCIGIAEGIETALAASCASNLPTVAAYCAGNLATWQWPADVHRLVIFADADKAGLEAAGALRVRALAARVRVEVIKPTDPECDHPI
jgi:hypothetical protein